MQNPESEKCGFFRPAQPVHIRCCHLLIFVLLLLLPLPALASIPNSVFRVDIQPKKEYTRITIRMADARDYTLADLPGNRLRLVIKDTGGTLFKKYRRYSDRNIGGLVFSRRDDSVVVTFRVSPKAGWRDLSRPGISAITLDVGPQLKPPAPRVYLEGREKIWNGVEKLVRDFDPPVKSEIPFMPTDRQILKNVLDDNDQKLFLSGEAALYKGRFSEAEEVFTQFASRQSPIKALALFRLGETWYKVQKYAQALNAFREAEKLWPAYVTYNPGVTFCYGDSIARSGDLASARPMLARLVARLADKKFAPALLVRLGDILVRQGHEQDGEAIYQTVADNFQDNKASRMAQMRLADHRFLQATPWNYRPLSDVYRDVSQQSGDLDMREESSFKHVLLESINGDSADALQFLLTFQRKFPRGVYAAVARTIREVLVADVYRHTAWDKDSAGLVRFVEEHQDYLSGSVDQPGFLRGVTRAYTDVARPIELMKLLSALVERQWAAAIAPDIYLQIADSADLIGDTAAAERALKSFVNRYPKDMRSRQTLERLGSLYFAAEKYQQVKDTLLWVLNKGEKASHGESYYQLGRSLWALQQFAPAAKAMELYLASPGARDPRLLPDAYYVAVSARDAVGERKAALKLLDSALKLPDNKRNEEFLYKAGDISMRDGNRVRARAMFEQLLKNGKDSDWQRLAQQSLSALDSKSTVR